MELITRYCSDKCCFTYFKLQCRRRQKQICSFCKNFMQLLQFYYVTIHSAFRYGFRALSDVCNCKLCKYLVFWILVPFLSTMQSALQAGQKGKKYIQKLPSLWQMATFSHSFCFYLLQFNSHQTLICLLV